MELKSTLEVAIEQNVIKMEEAKAKGYKAPPVLMEVFNLIKDSASLMTARLRTMQVATDIQPSIGPKDLKIASDMQLATSSEFLLNLIKEGLIKIVK